LFIAANSDHAITSAEFQVTFANPVPQTLIGRLQRERHQWRDELPAMSFAKNVAVNMRGDDPELRTSRGIEFAFLRPDGTPAWLLAVVGQQLIIQCNRYTRWRSVSETAFKLFKKLLPIFEEEIPDCAVISLVLAMQDDFFWSEEESQYDLSLLFQDCDLISRKIMSSGSVWHSRTAWFEAQSDDVTTLIHVNVGGTRDDEMAEQKGLACHVSIENLQDRRFRDGRKLTDIRTNFSEELAGAYEALHKSNKEILQELLTQQVTEEIGLSK